MIDTNIFDFFNKNIYNKSDNIFNKTLLEKIRESRDNFYKDYNEYPKYIIINSENLKVLIFEIEKNLNKKIKVLRQINGMEIILTVRDDIDFDIF